MTLVTRSRIRRLVVRSGIPVGAIMAVSAYALRTTRLVLVNDGFILRIPLSYVLTALVASAFLLALVFLSRNAIERVLAVCACILAAILSVTMLLHRVAVTAHSVEAQRGLSQVRIAWSDVEHVAVAPDEIALQGRSGDTLRIDLSRLAAHNRNALQRTISRRIRQHQLVGSTR